MAAAISSADVGQAGGVRTGKAIRGPPVCRFRIADSGSWGIHEALPQRLDNQVGNCAQSVVKGWRCRHLGRKGRFGMIVSVRSEAGIKEWSTPRRRCRTKAVI